MSQSLRPGVYSSYDITLSGVLLDSSRYAGVAAFAPDADTGMVYTISSVNQAILELGAGTPLSLAVQTLILSGISKVYAVAVNEKTPQEYERALLLLRETDDIAGVVCDCPDQACAAKLRGHVQSASEARRERTGFIGADTYASALGMAQELNCERMAVASPAARLSADTAPMGIISAAAIAGVILAQEDPSYNFSGSQLNVLHSLEGRYTEEQINTLIAQGVTVLEESYGVIECVRAMSTRTKTLGVLDRSFSSINTALIIDHVIRTLRSSLKLRLKGAKNNSFTLTGIASQTVVVLSELQDAGIINGYGAPKVYANPQDSSVCVVEAGFTVSHVINQIHLKAHIQI